MSGADSYIERKLLRLREELFELMRIRSVSTDPARRPDVRRAAEWLAERAAGAGLDAAVEETGGHPLVIARHRAGPAARTLLVYGHYDVQPADPVDEWRTDPFEPAIVDGRLVGRGAADDKTQIFVQLAAAEAALATGELPINLILVLEGEEEIGSPSLVPWVRQHATALSCDHALIADSMMFAPGRPSLIFGMRGIAYFEIEVATGRHDLHSGQYGGAVANPANALAAIIASFHDAPGHVAIASFYDDVAAAPPGVREGWADLGFDDAAFQATAGGAALVGEAGYSTPERLWIRPCLDVNGLLAGYTGPGKKTVLPARAVAKVSCRLVPDQDPARVETLLRAHVERIAPAGVQITIRTLQGNRPWREDPGAPLFRAAGAALEDVFGRAPVLVAHGGTMPIAPELASALGAPVAVLGLALPGANMHAPNEWFPVDHLEKGMRTMNRLYSLLAEA